MEFVLDDQVRWTDRLDVLDLGGGQALAGLMVAVAICALPEQTMPITLLAYSAEQRSYLTAPRHHGELVHGGNHHRGWAVVDLLVDDQHRQAGVRELAGLPFGEIAAPDRVAAVDERAATTLVDFDIAARRDFRSAPRTTGELRGRRRTRVVLAGVAYVLDGPMAVFGRPGA